MLWPPHAKSWLIGKDPNAGKDWGQEEKGTMEDEMAGWHHRLDGHEFEQALGIGDGQGSLECCSQLGSQRVGPDWATELIDWLDIFFPGHHILLNIFLQVTRSLEHCIDRRWYILLQNIRKGIQFCDYSMFHCLIWTEEWKNNNKKIIKTGLALRLWLLLFKCLLYWSASRPVGCKESTAISMTFSFHSCPWSSTVTTSPKTQS